ncbi:DUF6790 family protein [Microbacterium fluvii]|uniref:DUF6790 family protein n=1 Tax=Microbacterium fluvii TaxID=415215 RepID=A0ABW2HAW3_9MICO|nr:DUF6790 family protein [Microbacterium fluvii]MCU4671841.1 hypothetical protein [Microbacterium fluvii]
MYFVVVGLQTVVLPLLFGTIHLVVAPGSPIAIYGMWWAFWGVGTRLLVAGITQLVKPDITSGIMGESAPSAAERTVTRELAQANIAFGAVGLLALIPGWWPIAGLAGGVYLGLAYLGHLRNRSRNAMETFAMWTDLIVAVIVIAAGVVGLAQVLTN